MLGIYAYAYNPSWYFKTAGSLSYDITLLFFHKNQWLWMERAHRLRTRSS